MSSEVNPVWLGYTRIGGKFAIRHDEMGGGVALLGQGAKDLAAMLAYACNEAGLKTVIIDLDGHVSERVSGYVNTYDLSYFLYDVCRTEEGAVTHGQLAASAYTLALDLSFEQEAILNASIQKIATERGVASPSALYNDLTATEGFRGAAIDQLKGRLGSLRSLNMIGETDVVKKMLEGSFIANFSNVEPPEAAELAAGLFLAKALTLIQKSGVKPDIIILTEVHRLFKFHSIRNHSDRLLTTLLSAPVSRAFSSELDSLLDKNLVSSCSIRVLSSNVWNEASRGLILTPNMFMVKNNSYGYDEAFIPRPFEAKKGESKAGSSDEQEDEGLTKLILESISSNESATRVSLVSFLSAEYPREQVERTLDRLRLQGFIETLSKDIHTDYPLSTLTLTEAGKELLGRLS
jgi:hypothetical protein